MSHVVSYPGPHVCGLGTVTATKKSIIRLLPHASKQLISPPASGSVGDKSGSRRVHRNGKQSHNNSRPEGTRGSMGHFQIRETTGTLPFTSCHEERCQLKQGRDVIAGTDAGREKRNESSRGRKGAQLGDGGSHQVARAL